MTNTEWVKFTASISALWPGHGWPEATVRAAAGAFTQVDATAVKKALAELWKEGREFPPSPSVVFARAEAQQGTSRPALMSEATRDLTPEEIERNRKRKPLADLIAEMAERKSLTDEESA